MSCGLVVLRSWSPGNEFDDNKCTSVAPRRWPYPMLRWPQPISLQHTGIPADDSREITAENVMTVTDAPATQLAHIHSCPLSTVLECQHVEDGLLTRSPVSPGCRPPSG